MALTASHKPISAGDRADQSPADALVPDRWLPLARLLWLALVLLGLGLVFAGLPAEFAALQAACTDQRCADVGWYLSPDGLRQVQGAGFPLPFFATLVIAIQFVTTGAFIAGSALIIWRRSKEWMALFTAFFLLSFGLGFASGITGRATTAHPGWNVVVQAIGACGELGLSVFLYFFPDGRLRPRWLWWAVVGWCAAWLPRDLFPDSPFGPAHWPPYLEPLFLTLFFALAIGVQIWRYRRVADAGQRRQVKWVVYGITILLLAHLLLFPTTALVFGAAGGSPLQIAVKGLIFLLFTLIPLSLGVAILRHRLWDIDIVIRRTLVYGALTATIVVLYTLVVGGIGTLLRGAGSRFLPFFATALIAVLFQPLRSWFQHRANRLLYGERDDPYAALARLGQRLESTLTPEAVLPTILQAIREALKLPYAAITLAEEAGTQVAAQAGTPAPTVLRLPLVYGQELIGELQLAARAPGEDFSSADRLLLADLARQAGVAVHATRLSAEALRLNRELQGSRERLVAAREEERRRLRRDIHDGIGPQLAGFTLRLDVAKNLLRRDPAAAEGILTDLSARTQGLMGDIRRLVYALRPPALDELGLAGALRQHADGYDPGGLRVTIDAPATLPPLPAAVEVAAYRIAQEALTNVVRHAEAHSCTITLALERGGAEEADGPSHYSALCVTIEDDGRGLAATARAGVGLASMRERAAELGGNCIIEPAIPRGTLVRARLPL